MKYAILFLAALPILAADKSPVLAVECSEDFCWISQQTNPPSDLQVATLYKVDGNWVVSSGAGAPDTEERKEQPQGDEHQDRGQDVEPELKGHAKPWKAECLLLGPDGELDIVDCESGEPLSSPKRAPAQDRIVKIGLFEDRD